MLRLLPESSRQCPMASRAHACSILMTMLTTVFYLRTSNRLGLCSGHPDEFVVALEKGGTTTCSTVRSAAALNDVLTTLALLAINLTVVGVMAFIAVRSKLLAIARAPAGEGSQWKRQAAARVAKCCGCIPRQPPPASTMQSATQQHDPAAKVAAVQPVDDDAATIGNPLLQIGSSKRLAAPRMLAELQMSSALPGAMNSAQPPAATESHSLQRQAGDRREPIVFAPSKVDYKLSASRAGSRALTTHAV